MEEHDQWNENSVQDSLTKSENTHNNEGAQEKVKDLSQEAAAEPAEMQKENAYQAGSTSQNKKAKSHKNKWIIAGCTVAAVALVGTGIGLIVHAANTHDPMEDAYTLQSKEEAMYSMLSVNFSGNKLYKAMDLMEEMQSSAVKNYLNRSGQTAAPGAGMDLSLPDNEQEALTLVLDMERSDMKKFVEMGKSTKVKPAKNLLNGLIDASAQNQKIISQALAELGKDGKMDTTSLMKELHPLVPDQGNSREQGRQKGILEGKDGDKAQRGQEKQNRGADQNLPKHQNDKQNEKKQQGDNKQQGQKQRQGAFPFSMPNRQNQDKDGNRGNLPEQNNFPNRQNQSDNQNRNGQPGFRFAWPNQSTDQQAGPNPEQEPDATSSATTQMDPHKNAMGMKPDNTTTNNTDSTNTTLTTATPTPVPTETKIESQTTTKP